MLQQYIAGRSDWLTVSVLARIAVAGALFLIVAGVAGWWYGAGSESWHCRYVSRQIIYTLIGLGIFYLVYQIGCRRILTWHWYCPLVAILLIGAGWLSPYSGMFQHTWVRLAGISFQPVEFAKFALVTLSAAQWGGGRAGASRHWAVTTGVLIFLAMSGVRAQLPLVLLALLVMLTVARGKRSLPYWGVAAVLTGIVGGYYKIARPDVWQRWCSFLSPDQFTDHYNYYLTQSSQLISGLHQFGTSDPGAWQTLHQTELTLPLWAAQTGGVFAGLLIFVYCFWALCLICLTVKLADLTQKLSVAGFFVLLVVPFGYHFLMISGLVPMVNLPLPLLSFNAGNLWVAMAALGIIADIGRTSTQSHQ